MQWNTKGGKLTNSFWMSLVMTSSTAKWSNHIWVPDSFKFHCFFWDACLPSQQVSVCGRKASKLLKVSIACYYVFQHKPPAVPSIKAREPGQRSVPASHEQYTDLQRENTRNTKFFVPLCEIYTKKRQELKSWDMYVLNIQIQTWLS